MTGYREILRLSAQGISQRSIAKSCACSRNTVARVLTQAQQKEVEWSNIRYLSDGDLYQLLFPDQIQSGLRKIPDCEYIHREMAKSGVTLSLLWNEYCEQCRSNNEIPLKYAQYCNYYRKFAFTTKPLCISTVSRESKPRWIGQGKRRISLTGIVGKLSQLISL